MGERHGPLPYPAVITWGALAKARKKNTIVFPETGYHCHVALLLRLRDLKALTPHGRLPRPDRRFGHRTG